MRLPYEMFLLAERVPLLFRVHMISSALALLLLPAAIATRRNRNFHRPLGRALGVFVVVGGLTAIPVAVVSSSGDVARAGFFVQGLVWLGLLFSGWRAIRLRETGRHARMMLAMAAVTTGAVWFRLIVGLALYFELPFDVMYGLAAWIGWILPLALVFFSPALPRALAR